jgi:hypothetical protein
MCDKIEKHAEDWFLRAEQRHDCHGCQATLTSDTAVPDRDEFMKEVNRTEREFHDAATTRAERDAARRRLSSMYYWFTVS